MELWLSLLCLSGIIGLNCVGLYVGHFKENLMQCLGMGLVSLWAMSELASVSAEGITNKTLLLYVALFLYYTGTAVKVFRHAKQASPATST